MYKFLLYASIVTLIVFIIWVGVESLEIKIVLGIIGLTFIPEVRKKLYQAPLVIRKIKVALYTSFLLIFLLLIFNLKTLITEHNMDFIFVILVFLSCLLGSFVYGIPVSLFSDFVTANVQKFRFLLSFFVHIGFGCISFFFLGPLMFLATFIALLFFLIDEFLRKREYIYIEI